MNTQKQKQNLNIHAATESASMNNHLYVSEIHLNVVIRRYIMTVMGLDYLKHQESVRSNQAREFENTRTNTENERLKRQQNVETIRHNTMGEWQEWEDLSIRQGSLDETIRTHGVNEDISWSNLGETVRSNKARESENIRSNLARETELNRSNIARETENIRSDTMHNMSDLGAATYAEYSDPSYQKMVAAGGDTAAGVVTGSAVGKLVDSLNKLNPFNAFSKVGAR